jgi:hypothetical protein
LSFVSVGADAVQKFRPLGREPPPSFASSITQTESVTVNTTLRRWMVYEPPAGTSARPGLACSFALMVEVARSS